MVQMIIKLKDGPENIKEWVMIEVQGDVESYAGGSIEGKLAGYLYFTKRKKPILIIGYHILYGKITEINPCIAVLEKKKDISTQYDVLALVKKKIAFRTCPKPIVTLE